MAGTRRQFSAEFKREAVGLARRDGVSVAQVAGEVEIKGGILRRWINQFDSGRWGNAGQGSGIGPEPGAVAVAAGECAAEG